MIRNYREAPKYVLFNDSQAKKYEEIWFLEQLKRDKKYKSMATSAFLWRSALSDHGQPASALGATIDEASSEPGKTGFCSKTHRGETKF